MADGEVMTKAQAYDPVTITAAVSDGNGRSGLVQRRWWWRAAEREVGDTECRYASRHKGGHVMQLRLSPAITMHDRL